MPAVVGLAVVAMVALGTGCVSDTRKPLEAISEIAIYLSVGDHLFIDNQDEGLAISPALYSVLRGEIARALDTSMAGRTVSFKRVKSILDYPLIMEFDERPLKALKQALQDEAEVLGKLGVDPSLLMRLELTAGETGLWPDFTEELSQSLSSDAILWIHGQYHVSRDPPAYEAVDGDLIGLRVEFQAALFDPSGRQIWSAEFNRRALQGTEFGNWQEAAPDVSLIGLTIVYNYFAAIDEQAIASASKAWPAELAQELIASLVASINDAGRAH